MNLSHVPLTLWGVYCQFDSAKCSVCGVCRNLIWLYDMESKSSRFPFPFQPYLIQESFMEALYTALDQGKVGIFESPTGTVSLRMRSVHLTVSFKMSKLSCVWSCRENLWVLYVVHWHGWETMRSRRNRRLLNFWMDRRRSVMLWRRRTAPAKHQSQTGCLSLCRRKQRETLWTS